MKKLILTSAFALLAFCASAQTQDSPLKLQTGSNTYTNSEFQNKTDVYYTYTNSSDADQVLLVTPQIVATTFAVREGGESVVHSEQGDAQVFEVAKGKTVEMEVTAYSKTVTFTVGIIATNLTDQPLELPTTGTDVYLPCKNGNSIECHYKADKTGLLCISFYHAQTSYPAWKDAYGNSQSFGYDSDFDGNKMYCGKFLVGEGQEYTITFNNAVPDLLDLYIDSAEEGTTIDAPFVGGIDSLLTLPAAAGHYWFSLKRSQYIGHRFLMLDSDINLGGGSVRVYTSTTDTKPTYSVNGYMAMRMPVSTSDANYYVRIEKKQASAEDEQFKFTLTNETIAEDSVKTAPTVNAGQSYTMPKYNGTYYYAITIPSGITNKYLVIDGREGGKNSTVQVGTADNYETYIARGTNGYVRAAVSAQSPYIIMWTAAEGINGFPFALTYEDIVEGETAEMPISAVTDKEYIVPAGQTRYYLYTVQKESWLEATTSDLETLVTFMKHGYTDITVACERNENVSRLRAAEGDGYLLVVKAGEEDATLTLHEADRSQGESAEKAISISLGETPMAESALDTWYTYTATETGMLRVQSNIAYETDPMNPTKGSDVTVQTGLTGDAQSILGFDAQYNMVYDKEFAVVAGDVIYIHIKTYSAKTDKDITLSMREYEEGETPLKPKKLQSGDNTLPQTNSLTAPVWYSMDLVTGTFTISQPAGKSFTIYMYTADDTENAIATVQRDGEFGSYTYSLDYTVTTPAIYLFKLTNSQKDEVVNVSGSATSIDNVMSEKLRVESEEYNMNGQCISNNYRGVVICDGKKTLR